MKDEKRDWFFIAWHLFLLTVVVSWAIYLFSDLFN